MIARLKTLFHENSFVMVTLLISSVLRWILILRGGQFYFSDESRYGIAQDALALMLEGKLRTGLLTLLDELAHVGFKLTALVPALFQHAFDTTLVFPAIFFSFFSILNLFLIWKIALQAGAPLRVANYALLLAASSQVLLYYSRHLFPYDQAMFFGLLGLYVALKNNAQPGVPILCGTLSFLCFITYNGYWAIAAFAIIVCTFNGAKEKNWIVKRPAFLALGFLAPLAILLLVCFLVGKDVFGDYGVYLQKIVQGSFSEGWSLPFEYFWYAEHGFSVLIGLFSLLALILFRKKRNPFLYVALGGTLFIYLSLVIPSNILHTFVVYGRTARQIMPFLALSAAYGLSALRSWKPVGLWLANIVVAIILIQTAWNYSLSYKIVYPREFIQNIQQRYPEFEVSSKMMRFYSPLICQNEGFFLINFHYIHNRLESLPDIQGEMLMRAPHPVNFLPYLYEGYTPEQRQAIRRENYEMTFYKLDPSYLAGHKKEFEKCDQTR
jgi:hypothetical protein